jgi:AI-2 transport protein TqsA
VARAYSGRQRLLNGRAAAFTPGGTIAGGCRTEFPCVDRFSREKWPQAGRGEGQGDMGAEASRFTTVFQACFLAALVGWLLVVGKDLILPIFAAVIATYVLTSAADAMARLPVLGRLPPLVHRILLVIAFTLCLVGFGAVVAVTVDQLMVEAPTYSANLQAFAARLADAVGLEKLPTWDEIRTTVEPQVDLKGLIVGLLGSLTSIGSGVFLIALYAIFLIAEKGSLPAKLAAVFPDGDRSRRMQRLFADTNRQIGEYLAVKTLINVILGAVSWVLMLLMGLDFALFWAVLIGLFNYIPFVGTVAIVFPILLSIAQFGSLTTTLILAALLALAQLLSDNVLEPRLFSRQLNLSPFVIIVALSFWSALWGLPGAILAIPITSMMVIVFAAFPETRFLAVLLAEHVDDVGEPLPDKAD